MMATSQLRETDSSEDDMVLVVGYLPITRPEQTGRNVSEPEMVEGGCETTAENSCSRLGTGATVNSAPCPGDELGMARTDVQSTEQAHVVHEITRSAGESPAVTNDQTSGHTDMVVGPCPMGGQGSRTVVAAPGKSDIDVSIEEGTVGAEGGTLLDNPKQFNSAAAACSAPPENSNTLAESSEAEREDALDVSNCQSSRVHHYTLSKQEGRDCESTSLELPLNVRPDVTESGPTKSRGKQRKCSQRLFPERGIPELETSKHLIGSTGSEQEGGMGDRGKSFVENRRDTRSLSEGSSILPHVNGSDLQLLQESVPLGGELDHLVADMGGTEDSNNSDRTKGKRKMKRGAALTSRGSGKVRRKTTKVCESANGAGRPNGDESGGGQFSAVSNSTTSSIPESTEETASSEGLSVSVSNKVAFPRRRSHRTSSKAVKVPSMSGDKLKGNSDRGKEPTARQSPENTTRWFEACLPDSLESETRGDDTRKVDNDKGVGTTPSKGSEPVSEPDSDEELLDPSLSIDEEEHEVGDLVWAKHPWTIFWPAVVNEVVPGRQTKITVEYFNAGSDLFTCQYSIRAIRKFSLENRKIMSEGYQSKRAKDFKVAVDQAMEYLEKRALGSSPVREPPSSPITCQSFDSPPLTPTEGNSYPLGPSCSTPVSPRSPAMVVGDIPEEPQDPEREKKSTKLREKWSRVEDRLIRYILRDDTKERLLKIWSGKIKSTKHEAFFSSSSKERDRLKYKALIGPLITDEKIDEVTAHLHDIYQAHCQATTEVIPNTAYILDVWLPEAVLFATCKSRRVGQKKATQLLSLEGLQAYRDLELL